MWFWREVVDDIPLQPESYKILHPEIIHKTGQVLQRYALKQGNVSSYSSECCKLNSFFFFPPQTYLLSSLGMCLPSSNLKSWEVLWLNKQIMFASLPSKRWCQHWVPMRW